jgi:hypothetical protein
LTTVNIYILHLNFEDEDKNGGLATINIYEAKFNNGEVSTSKYNIVHEDTSYDFVCNSFDIDKDHKLYCGNAGHRIDNTIHTADVIQMCTFNEYYIRETKT